MSRLAWVSFTGAAICAAASLFFVTQSQLLAAAPLAWLAVAFAATGIWLHTRRGAEAPTSATRWQLVKPYFDGPKTYTFAGPGGTTMDVAVDERGCFDLNEWPTIPLGVFARRLKN